MTGSAEELLARFVPPPRSQRETYSLDKMKLLMQALGNPQDIIPVIHVAGTSGKTSTCYYIAELLKTSGLKVGLTISPHVTKISERVQINGQPLPDELFLRQLKSFIKVVDDLGFKPTYFEILMAFAYWYFALEKVDVVVVETGLGGLLDGSNVVNSSNKTCVITDIGLDHVEVLGHTSPEIAAQKAGIVHASNQVFMLEQNKEIEEVIAKKSQKENARLTILKERAESSALPLFQNRNFSLARQVVEWWLKQNGDKLSDEQIQNATKLQIPARMEVFKVQGKTIILDGAHNPQKLAAFVDSFNQLYPNTEPIVITAMLKSGNDRLKGNCNEIAKLNPSKVIVTEFISRQDIRKQSASAEHVALELKEQNLESIEVTNNAKTALQNALSSKKDIIVVTGSLYLIFDLRPLLTNDLK